MRVIWREIRRSLRGRTQYWLLMCVVLALSIATAQIAWEDYDGYRRYAKYSYRDKSSRYNAYDVERAFIGGMNEVGNKEGWFHNLGLFYEDLKQSPGITVYNAEMVGYMPVSGLPALPNEFSFEYAFYYEDVEGMESVAPEGIDASGLAVVQATENIFVLFDLTLQAGGYPSEESYVYERGRPVDVVLGSAFRPYFEIGDRITIQWISEEVDLNVTGFLDEGLTIPDQGGRGEVCLNRWLLFPSFERFAVAEENSGSSEILWRQHFVDKAYPMFLSDMDSVEADEYVNRIALRLDVPLARVDQIAMAHPMPTGSGTFQSQALTLAVVLLAIATVAVTVAILSGTEFRTSLPVYAIYLLTGGTPGQIFLIHALEVLLMMIPAFLIALPIAEMAYITDFSTSLPYLLPTMCWIAAGLFVVSMVPGLFHLRFLRLSQLVRRKNT